MPYQCNISQNLISYFDLARLVPIKKPYSLHQSALVGDQNGIWILGLYRFVSEEFDYNVPTRYFIFSSSNGDARSALNCLELVMGRATSSSRYGHYQTISCHKNLIRKYPFSFLRTSAYNSVYILNRKICSEEFLSFNVKAFFCLKNT